MPPPILRALCLAHKHVCLYNSHKETHEHHRAYIHTYSFSQCDYSLLFLPPYPPSLSPLPSIKSLDLVCMKELDKKVNIIPIIGKADTMARSELPQFKARVRAGGRERERGRGRREGVREGEGEGRKGEQSGGKHGYMLHVAGGELVKVSDWRQF